MAIDDQERQEIFESEIAVGRGGVVTDLKCIIDFINSELRGLRNEVRAIAGLPPLPRSTSTRSTVGRSRRAHGVRAHDHQTPARGPHAAICASTMAPAESTPPSSRAALRVLQRRGLIVPATVVDHVRPHKGNPAVFWDSTNLQSLCVQCHDAKTKAEMDARKPMSKAAIQPECHWTRDIGLGRRGTYE